MLDLEIISTQSGMLRHHERVPLAMTSRQKLSLGLLLGSFVALSLAYNVVQPIWEAPDESTHFAFIRYVQLHHALPRGSPGAPAHVPAWDPTSEYTEVPLYYVALAGILHPIKLLPHARFHQNPYVAWPGHPWREAVALHRSDEGWPYQGLALFVHAGRLVSTVLGLLTLLATFALVATVAGRASDALFATAWLAWNPGLLLASARLDNDAAAMIAGATTTLLCAWLLTRAKRVSSIGLLATSVCLTGTLLSKLDTAYLVPLVVTTSFVVAEPRLPLRRALGRRLAAALLALVLPTAALAGWWIVVGRTFQPRIGADEGFGVARVWNAIAAPDWTRIGDALWNLNATWWGGVGFGALKLWPPIVYVLLAVPLIGLIAVGARALADGRWWLAERRPARWASVLVCVSALPLFYATVARQALPSVSLDSNARFTLPAAAAVALIVTLGGRYLPLGNLRRLLAIGYLAIIGVLAIATAVVLLPRVPAPAIPARLARSATELSAPPVAAFANGVDLLAATETPSRLLSGETLSVGLLWRVDASPPRDFTAFTQLIHQGDERRIVGSDAIPFQASFPPRLWQPGEFVEEHRQLVVPANLQAGRYKLIVGMYYYQPERLTPIPTHSSHAEGNVVAVAWWIVVP